MAFMIMSSGRAFDQIIREPHTVTIHVSIPRDVCRAYSSRRSARPGSDGAR
jgi:hypothetical protein